jgi:4-carboxymuconolactone decarboxylase
LPRAEPEYDRAHRSPRCAAFCGSTFAFPTTGTVAGNIVECHAARCQMSVEGGVPEEPRLAPLPLERWGADVLAALVEGRASLISAELKEALETEDLARLSEILPNHITTMLYHPALTGRFLAYNGVFLSDSALPARWRELVVLRAAWKTGSTYEWVQHVRMSPRYGITTDEVEALSRGAAAGTWSEVEADLLSATDQMIDRYSIDDATWSRLVAHLDERQLVELPFVVGSYVGQAMAFNSFRVQLDPSLRSVNPPVMPPTVQ